MNTSNDSTITEEEKQKYIKGLADIRRHRETDQKNFKYFAISWLISSVIAKAYPSVALVSIAITVLFFYSFFRTAAVPCPRCNKPFIRRWAMPVVGHHTKECQNCKLSFDLLTEHENSTRISGFRE